MLDITQIKEYDLTIPEVNSTKIEIPESLPQCCVNNQCRACGVNPELTPLLFIHGHSFNEQNTPDYSMSEFTKLQEKFEKLGYLNAGELDVTPDEPVPGEWGRAGVPVTARATYYYIKHYSLGGRTVTTQKSERVENYALRLKEVVDMLKLRTGSNKITIVAHSMGGLVAREYLALFGTDSVKQVIFINTPHKGVVDRIEQLCSLIGASKECEDMSEGSIFLGRLNARKLPDIPLYAIRSTGCPMGDKQGDGIVTEESSYLEGAANILIKGNCTDQFQTDLHSNILDPVLHPELFDLLKNMTLG